MSSSTSPSRWWDVFVSYRTEDEKDHFVSLLRDWLKKEGVECFRDDDPRDGGKKIDEKILAAIHHSRVAVIVLSEKYAGSWWCLNELVEVLKCKREPQNLLVIPVFYHVHPDDLTNLRNKSKFGLAFEDLCEGESVEQRTTWKKALQEVKNLSGFQREQFRDEATFLNAVTCSVHEKFSPARLSNILKNEIAEDRLANDVIPLLKIGQEDGHMIGISGTEGIGKTMVAKAVCKATLDKFDRLIFLNEDGVVEDWKLINGQMKLPQNLNSSHGYTEKIKNDLHHEKILLVLDDVTKKDQIKKLGVEDRHLYRHGSRILITTRDRNLLKDLEVDDEYIVEGLNRDEAFRLFCLHAFGEEEPREGFEELSRYLAHYAGGHPLALRKWGSKLKNLTKNDWQKFSEGLKKDPKSNFITPDLKKIFQQYPCRHVGRRGGHWTTKTWKNEGYTGVWKIEGGVDSEGIKFITVHYNEKGGSANTVTLGTKGSQTHTVPLEGYLTYVSGHTKEDSARTILQSLTFHTNSGKRGSIGTDEERRKFSFPYTGHKIVGFRWSCNGSHLESIEAIYKRVPHTPIGCLGRVFGPFGGAGEKTWATDDITGIYVSYKDFINKINFEVHAKSSKPRTTYGENGEECTFKVKLEAPNECITSFSGYFENACDGRILIKSLTFRTNKRILGPIGRESGKHFSSPLPSEEAVKVTRFFGRTVDNCLESIGAQVKSDYPFRSVGLFGCSTGSYWKDRDDHYPNVREIDVEFAQADVKSVGSVQKTIGKTSIRSITFWYGAENDKPLQKKRHPGNPPVCTNHRKITIDKGEYLTSLSGYYTEHGITSLTFWTDKGRVKHIGREEGIHFSSPVTGGKIVGFYGRSGKNLEAIGAYFKQIPHLYPIKSIGPFGGSSEDTREYVNIKDVRKIKVEHRFHIHSIKFVFKEGSDASHLVRQGGCAEGYKPKANLVTLDYPREYLTSISGYLQNDAIQSLTFHSNKEIYGPYGKEDGKYFWYPSNGSRITGFYGSQDPNSGTFKSIEVIVEPIPRMCPFKTVGPFGGSGGIPWDDGVHTDVRAFRISYHEAIRAIGIAYDNNGSFVSGSDHGMGHVNDSFALGLKPGNRPGYEEVILDYPKERLRLIWVWEDPDSKTGQIHDLKIITTSEKRTYGPFIPESLQKRDKLTPRRIPSKEDGGRIVGFFGRAEGYLNSIGVRLEPVSD